MVRVRVAVEGGTRRSGCWVWRAGSRYTMAWGGWAWGRRRGAVGGVWNTVKGGLRAGLRCGGTRVRGRACWGLGAGRVRARCLRGLGVAQLKIGLLGVVAHVRVARSACECRAGLEEVEARDGKGAKEGAEDVGGGGGLRGLSVKKKKCLVRCIFGYSYFSCLIKIISGKNTEKPDNISRSAF